MKALLVKTSSLGDVVHALPAVTEAARRGVRFDWVVEEAFKAVPAAHPAVDRVIPIAWRRWRGNLWRSRREMRSFFQALASERYDLALDSQGLLKSALVTSRVRSTEKVGFSRKSAREPAASMFYGRVVEVAKGQHAIDRQCRLFAGAFGYNLGDDDTPKPSDRNSDPTRKARQFAPAQADAPHLRTGARLAGNALDGVCDPIGLSAGSAGKMEQTQAHSERRCIFLHGATWNTKLWPEPMWVELARLAKDSNWQPALPWGNDEEHGRAQRIAEASGATLLPAMHLGGLMEELRHAGLAIGVDSGLAHLAAALGVPTVVLYGPTANSLTGCRGDHAHNLQANFACSPCLSKTCRYRGAPVAWRGAPVTPPCYGALGPTTVWAAALETMRSSRVAGRYNKKTVL